MKKIFNFLIIGFVATTMVSCGKKDVSKYDRPLDHWVFRSVMDSMPRMLTTALHDDVWVAYSAEDGNLYKVWDGTVNFDGAVFTTAHGPQPTSIGDAWFVNEFASPWTIKNGDKSETPIVQYKGHRFVDQQVEFMYELGLKNGDKISVNELESIDKAYTLYPNPSSGLITLSGEVQRTPAAIEIMDAQGKQVLKLDHTLISQIDISQLPASVYILKIYRDDGFFETHKIIKL